MTNSHPAGTENRRWLESTPGYCCLMGFVTTVESVQLGVPRTIQHRGGQRSSGIDKREVPSISIHRDGVAGDHIAADYHGGAGQAVYVYSREDYEFFERELNVSLTAGVFGENITVGRIPPDPSVGDRLVFDKGVVLEVTGPRTPCSTFAARMREVVGSDPARGWVKRFTAARRPGVYCRVIEEGEVYSDMRITIDRASTDRIRVMELWDLMESPNRDSDVIARGLSSPVAHDISEWLAGLSNAETPNRSEAPSDPSDDHRLVE